MSLDAKTSSSTPNPAEDDYAVRNIGLFDGDAGELPLETRRVLVQLLLGPALDERRHPELWPILLRDEAVVRQRLGDLFLLLILDRERGIAFLRQAVSEELSIPVLLRKAPLTFIDSALLLHLREKLAQADARVERAAVSTQELREYMNVYMRASKTDHVVFGKRVNAAFEKMKKYGILRDLDRDGDRKEISPTLRILFDTSVIAGLIKTYRGLAEHPEHAALMDAEGRTEDAIEPDASGEES